METSQTGSATVIEGCSRLHFGLLDLSGSTRRVDGGLGLAIRDPSFRITVRDASSLRVTAPPGFKGLGVQVYQRLNAEIPLKDPVWINIETKSVRHVGYGSTTQCLLAVGAALLRHAGHSNFSPQLAARLGRGGTSGVGIYAANLGGLVVDGGRSWPMEKREIGPSFSFNFGTLPPLIARLPFPSWGIVTVVPRGVKRIYGRAEVARFVASTPIPLAEVDRGCRLVLLGILPTVAASDFRGFTEAMRELRDTGFKRIEWNRLGAAAYDWEEWLTSRGVRGISVSSWGPAMFGFVETCEEAIRVARAAREKDGLTLVFATAARNCGYFDDDCDT